MLAVAMGITSSIDPQLQQALEPVAGTSDADFNLWVLFMVMCAVSLRLLPAMPGLSYNATLEAIDNNSTCFMTSVEVLSSCIFAMGASESQTPNQTILGAQSEFVRVCATNSINPCSSISC
eukprot:m.747627 g.747627  ORF g.747627 m.747627 type:complete len:121 (-) comp58964_c0_seq2:1885-2247(-)